MATNTNDPGDWYDIVSRIRNASDNDVATRIAERERRFDNYFADFDFTPTIAQPTVAIAATVNYAVGQRIGRWITMAMSLTMTAVGPGNFVVRIFIPEALPVIGVSGTDVIQVGTFEVNDISASKWYIGNASMDGASRSITGKAHNATLGIGAEAAAFTLAIGDIVKCNVRYPTSATSLF